MNFWEIFRFEIWHQLRRPSTWLFFLAVTGLNFMIIGDLVSYAGSVENLLLNAPVMVAQFAAYTNNFGLLLIVALAGDGAMRDISSRMDPLIYTSPVSKFAYLGGRFLGITIVAALLIIISKPLSMWLATYGLIDQEILGPVIPSVYLSSALFITLPNVFIASIVIYSAVLLARHAMVGYLGALVLVVLSIFSVELAGGNWEVGKLLDPSTTTLLTALGRTLTPQNINTEPMVFSGSLLANRVIWLCLSLLTGIFVYLRFRLSNYGQDRGKTSTVAADDSSGTIDYGASILDVGRAYDFKARLYQIRAFSWQYYLDFLKSPAVLILPAMFAYAFILIPNISSGPMMVPILPTTGRMVVFLNHSALQIILVIPITFLAGQLIWRERDTRLSEISDAVPASDTVMILSKYAGLVLILLNIQLVLMLAGMAIQTMAGYHQYDVATYIKQLFTVQLVDHLTIAAVAVFIHVLINQKYVAHMLVFIFYLYAAIPTRFGIEHKLLIFNSDTGLANSVFYDESAFILGWILFKIYWIAWGILLIIIAKHLWVRGREAKYLSRISAAGYGLKTSRSFKICLVLLICTGSIIFFNTNILNHYNTRKERTVRQVEYERLYSKYKNVLQPYHTDTKLDIEIYPRKGEAVINGRYRLKNGGTMEIDTIHISLSPDVATNGIQFSREARTVLRDEELGHLIYVLKEPLLPNDVIQMAFKVRFKRVGFTNNGIETSVINNGSYFQSSDWLPAIGYQESREITNAGVRKDYRLSDQPASLTASQNTAALIDRRGQERVNFEARVGTSDDQIAIAPGSLKRTWSQNGRRYFHYVSEKPVRNAYIIYSADYKKRNSKWNDTELNIFHHPANVINLGPIEKSMKASLEYYSKNFSSYDFKELRMVEYADPGTGGISLPGSIGYSTNFALLNTKNDKRGFDLPFAVTAHEIAHQWWPHQLTAARVNGRALITESLAWYSALGVVKQTYGTKHLKSLLDAMRAAYLAPMNRAGVPLLESSDPLDAYRKGPFAMYAVREYIGEEKVNMALRNLLYKFKSGEPPYATSKDFYQEVKTVTPDSLQYLLHDLFEANTFWELETKKARVRKVNDGWLLEVNIKARKVTADVRGIETELPMNDLIEIGVFSTGAGVEEKILHLQKYRIKSGSNSITIKISQKPGKVGIDPRNLLIDNEVDNNIKLVD